MRNLYKILGLIIFLLGIFSFTVSNVGAVLCDPYYSKLTCCCKSGWRTDSYGCLNSPCFDTAYPLGTVCSVMRCDKQTCGSCDALCASGGGTANSSGGVCPVADNPPPPPPKPKCNDCTVSCPSPLTSSGDGDLILTNYDSCSHSTPCDGDIKRINCYEPNTNRSQPVMDHYWIYGNPDFYPPWGTSFLPTKLGFTSSTITGGSATGANRPFIVDTQFSDPNGAADIETMGVWFRDTAITAQSPGVVGTPLYIDTSTNPGLVGKTFGDNSWGFLMHKEGGTYPNEPWVPYVIAVNPDGVNHKWVRAYKYADGSFAIPKQDGTEVVRIGGLNITATGSPVISTTSNTRQLKFSVMPNNNYKPREVDYDMYAISHDKFSFTPYDNYPATVTNIGAYWKAGQIRYPRQWIDTGSNWRIDTVDPTISLPSYTVSGLEIEQTWNVADPATSPNLASGIYGVVVNIYRGSGSVDGQTVTVTPSNGSSGSATTYTPLLQPSPSDTKIGNLDSGFAYKSITSSLKGGVKIGLSNFTKGNLIIYVTVFDNAGNMRSSSTSIDFSDWIITKGDLFYSSKGVNFEVKSVAPNNAWDSTKLFGIVTPSEADISTEMFAMFNSPDANISKGINNSYTVKNYTNTLPTKIYKEYKDSFLERKSRIPDLIKMKSTPAIISGGTLVPTYCSTTKPCYGEFSSLTIGPGFSCNGTAIFFVEGNLTINPDIINTNPNRDACMFVVGGNVIIKEGSVPLGPNIYDEINAFIVADGTITIETDRHGDGLLVKGGLISTSTTLPSIDVKRGLPLTQKKTFPVLVVSAHPKYPPLSKIYIGTPLNVVSTEVGFKGY